MTKLSLILYPLTVLLWSGLILFYPVTLMTPNSENFWDGCDNCWQRCFYLEISIPWKHFFFLNGNTSNGEEVYRCGACLLRQVLKSDCSTVKRVYHKSCAEIILHLGADFPEATDQFSICIIQIHMTQCEEGRGYLHRDITLSPSLHPSSATCHIPDVSSSSSDLAALVHLALWCVCLKLHSADRVTLSMNK